MDLQKIGTFLKELRNGEGLTQEQLAEKLNVSRRTVSRWETGSNMPDLDLLIEMADQVCCISSSAETGKAACRSHSCS